jgi:membrane fusion protein, multidrug efflux system
VRLIFVGSRVFGVVVVVVAANCQRQKPMVMPQRPPSPVTATIAEAHDVPVYIDQIGQTAPSELVNIQPQVTGQIMQRLFEDGANLKAGDRLFVIDRRTYEAAVKQAEANLEQAKAQLELAKAEFQRYDKAFKIGAASPEDYDIKKGNLNNASAQVKVNEAALDTAKLTLSFCTINSPIDGRAGQRMMDVGNIVKANEGVLLTIQRITPIYADFTITERDLPEVRGQVEHGNLKALVSVPEFPEGREGSLTFLDTNVQQGAGRIRLRVTLANADRYFWPGQFVNVRLVLRHIEDAVLLPYGCTQVGQEGPYVFVIRADSTVEMRPVKLGQAQTSANGTDMVVIAGGVKAGEKVVQTGQMAIGPGAKVRVVQPLADETRPSRDGTTAPTAAEAATRGVGP